ncbi:Hypothetical predicted protein [Cloeon dipterum]|uniref:Uncharacterized protein n=1 Tax=Cloeon dipterum TaxID=197152 RepID=A0A8S1D101_9INSE|nr:Hypothetical predicted protein [Cloeon dipterum]
MNLSNSTIANVTALTERAVSISTVHVTEVILSLGLVRNEVITIHDALYNLPELETATNAGTAQYNKTLEEITSINAFVPRLFTEANEQIQNAIIGQVCQPATDVYIGLQVIQSSLNDYYRKIEDDQVLYQFRASLANNALQTVIAQPVVLFSLLSVKEFTMKQIGGLALLLAVKVLTAQVALAESTSSNNLPSTRDLNDDISAAGVALKNFDFEVDRYTGVLNVFQDEIDISIRNTYGEIERNLQLIPELSSEIVAVLTSVMANGVKDASSLIASSGVSVLAGVGSQIIATNSVLQSDLASLDESTLLLNSTFQDSKGQLLVMGMTVPSIFIDVDSQIRSAIDGLSGTPVVDILVGLQTVINILYDQNFGIENSNIVYEFRGDLALQALQAVIDQVPL